MDDLTEDDINALLARLPGMSALDQEALLEDIEKWQESRKVREARDDFLAFCHRVYPGFKEGPHHRFLLPILTRVEQGTEIRVTCSMPPRFGKSETISYLFVAWYLGHNPSHHIIMVTHTADLSATFGRKIRDLIDSPVYQEIFPDTVISKDKAAAANWLTTKGGKYLAVGIGANVAGHGAHLLIADDLVSENAMMANPDTAFAGAWEYMQIGPLQRLMPGGRIVMIGCMTAETGVLMADGSEKEIQHIQIGDTVATYDDGKVTTSRITNWIKHPSDFVYRIRTTSGIIVRANKRHPFLVDRDGARTWVRVRDLKVGDCLVGVVQQKGACAPDTPKECVVPAIRTRRGLKEKLDLLLKQRSGPKQKRKPVISILSDGKVDGKGLSAQPKGVASLSHQRGFVIAATERHLGVLDSTAASLLSRSAKVISSTGTAFLRKLTTLCLPLKAVFVPSVSGHQPVKTPARGESQSCTLTTAMTPIPSEGFCATTATWPSVTRTQKSVYSPLPATYATTPDAIVEIVEDGFEPVFDMEVERTENFIANGVVSHNTRWGKKDPIGRALAWAEDNPTSPQWTEVRFPAILPSGKSLWTEQWPIDQLIAKKASMLPQFWSAQYMQEPTSEEGALIKREWWKMWDKDKPPVVEFIIQAWDTAHEAKTRADYSACVTMGVWTTEDGESRVILLDCIRGQWEFPDLKVKVMEQWRMWEPDSLIVEKKAAGAPLIQELRRMNIVVQEVSPSRKGLGMSNDKYARMNGISPLFQSGLVYAPDKRWAHELINEVAEFPYGENDDRADCVQMCLQRYRDGGFIRLASDYNDDEDNFRARQRAYYG